MQLTGRLWVPTRFLALVALLVTAAPVPAATITGAVFDDANGNGHFDAGERPLAGIRVCDGRLIRVTNSDGRFAFTGEQGYRNIFMVIPSGRWPVANRWFVGGEAESFAPIEFALRTATQAADTFVLFSDVHIDGGVVSKVAQACERINQIEPEPAFIICLGDLLSAGDQLPNVEAALEAFSQYKSATAGLKAPLFNVPGNHDHVGVRYPEGYIGSPYVRKEGYARLIGPLHFSFDYGPYHFIALDCTRPGSKDTRSYREEILPECIDWLRQDLAFVPNTQPIVLLMHEPMMIVTGREKVLKLLTGRNVVAAFAGHSHRTGYSPFGPWKVYEDGSLSGDRWSSNSSLRAGYNIVRISPNGFKPTYVNAFPRS